MLGIFQLVCWPTNGRRCGVVAGVQFSTLYYFFFLFIAVLVFIFKKIIIIFCCCCSFVWRGQHFDFVLHTTSLLFYMIPISFRWVSLMLSRPCQLQSVTPLKMYIKKNSQSVTFLSALPPFNQVRHGMCFSIFFPPMPMNPIRSHFQIIKWSWGMRFRKPPREGARVLRVPFERIPGRICHKRNRDRYRWRYANEMCKIWNALWYCCAVAASIFGSRFNFPNFVFFSSFFVVVVVYLFLLSWLNLFSTGCNGGGYRPADLWYGNVEYTNISHGGLIHVAVLTHPLLLFPFSFLSEFHIRFSFVSV